MNVLAFALLLGFMVIIHELGHFVMAKLAGIKVEEFGVGFPPRVFAVRRGETAYSLNLIPLGGFVRMLGEEDPQEPRSFARAPRLWRIGVLVAGSTMNLIAAAVFFAIAFTSGWPTVTASQVEISQVLPDSPAQQIGLQSGDVILRLDGEDINLSSDLRTVTQRSLGESVPIVIQRGEQQLELTVTPRSEWPESQGPIGIAIRDRPTEVEPVEYGIVESIGRGIRQLANTLVLTLSIPYLLIEGLVSPEMVRPVGPVGLFNATSQATEETARTGWWFPILYMAGTLGAGLGIANLLPIPGLDGGRLVFVLIEIVRGRRVSPEREGLIHLIGMALLVSLVIVITYFDILFPMDLDFDFR